MLRRVFVVVVAGFLAAVLSVPVDAQVTSASIEGTVKDGSGGVLPGVVVTVKDTETNSMRTSVTDATGTYHVTNLVPGTYEVVGELPGFKRFMLSKIPLSVGQALVVVMTLELGELSQEVTVTGDAMLLETKSASLSGLVEGGTVRTLPLNGRSYDQLALLTPGVTSYNLGGQNVQNGAGLKMSISGARPESIYFMLDGTNILDHSNFTPGSAAGNNLGVDAIREFRVFSHNYSAEVGVRGGGAVSVISRSGTNQFHGSGFEFLRNSAMDARNFFDPISGPPAFQRNQFGFNFGGPLLSDKTQFFTNIEWLRQQLGRSLIAVVPTDLARQGILPTATVTVSPLIKPYLSLYPLPNGRDFGDGTGEYRDSVNQPTHENFGMLRVDHRLSTKDNMFVRYTGDRATVTGPAADLARYLAISENTSHFFTIQETHIFKQNLLNEARFAFNRTSPAEDAAALPAIDPALKFYDSAPNVGQLTFSLGKGTDIGAAISSVGIGGNAPRTFGQNIFQFTDSLSQQLGRHSLRYGVDVQLLHINGQLNENPNGSYSFSSLSNFLRAIPSGMNALAPGSDTIRHYQQLMMGSYIQDDFELRSNLTVNIGLRHEFTTIPSEADGKIANLLNVTDAAPTRGVFWTTNNSLKDFAPRGGIAWDPFGNQRTSVRAGAGVFYSQVIGRNWYTYALRQTLFSGFATDPSAPFPHPFINGVKQILQQNDRTDPNLKTPTMAHFNLTIQQQLAKNMMFEIGYVGSRGYNLLRNSEGNIKIPTVQADGTLFYPTNAPFTNPNFGSIFTLTSDAHSWYDSLQTRISKQYSSGLQFQASYTWAKSIDEASTLQRGQGNNSPSFTMIPNRPDLDKGLSSFDVRHTFAFNLMYDVPHANVGQVAGSILNGWQIGGIVRAQSGTPFDAETGVNQSRDGAQTIADRPNLKPGASNNPIIGDPNHWFDATVFEFPIAGTYGNVGRNTLTGPGLFTVDALLVREVKLKGSSRLSFRAEVFNLLNRANFGLPRNKLFNATGQIPATIGLITTTATSSRQAQLGLKLTF
jgi:hypothetical protein